MRPLDSKHHLHTQNPLISPAREDPEFPVPSEPGPGNTSLLLPHSSVFFSYFLSHYTHAHIYTHIPSHTRTHRAKLPASPFELLQFLANELFS